MIPLRDHDPTGTVPFVTMLLITTNAAVFVDPELARARILCYEYPPMPTVEFYFEKKKVDVGDNANLRGVALAHGVEIYEGPFKLTNCHGLGLCGTCVVEILEGMENLNPRTKAEMKKLKGLPPTYRLSCQCRVRGQVSVITKPKAG